MTRMLEEAIKKVRELPEAAQNEAAELLLSVAGKSGQLIQLGKEVRDAIRDGQAQAQRGEFVNDEDMAAFFKRHGIKNGGI